MAMHSSWFYNLLYRIGAPWEMGPREELVSLVESGRVAGPGRAIDLGCGSGANAIFLAEHGFETVGVDFAAVALRKAREKMAGRDLEERLRFVQGDLTAASIPGAEGEYDFLVDYSTLDDLTSGQRHAMAGTVRRLSKPGSRFLLWCFYAAAQELPRISFSGPSALTPVLAPGEERSLFGDSFAIERLPSLDQSSHTACFLMTRHQQV
jgi:ubiquinone/menaquinone biosynthesis C-methylase UbiE